MIYIRVRYENSSLTVEGVDRVRSLSVEAAAVRTCYKEGESNSRSLSYNPSRATESWDRKYAGCNTELLV